MDLYRVEYEQRADQIALILFGDVKYTKDLIKANPKLQRREIVTAGTIIKVPKIEEDINNKNEGVNLWS